MSILIPQLLQLEVLNISGCIRCGDRTLVALARSRPNRFFELHALSCHHITSAGIQELAIACAATLVYLYFYVVYGLSLPLSRLWLICIKPLVCSLFWKKGVHLYSKKIDESVVMHLAQHCHELQRLELKEIDISDSALATIGSASWKLKELIIPRLESMYLEIKYKCKTSYIK